MTTKTTIERLGHRGDGIAPGPIYAPGTLPGEVVEGALSGDRLSNIKIVTPSSDRVAPPCRHFKSCGGCSLQHVSDGFLEIWKVQIVRDALAAHGLDGPVQHLCTSPAQSRLRAKLSGRRTKAGALVGLHARGSGIIIEIPDCQLLHPDLVAMVPALQALTMAGASRKGEVAFAITRSDVGVDVAVSGAKPLDRELQIRLAVIGDEYDLARLTWGADLIVERRAPVQKFGPVSVPMPANAFLQATEAGQQALIATVMRGVGPAKHVLDLFSGCGTFSLPLAVAAKVHAVENDAEMLAALDKGWRNAERLKQITTETRDLFRHPLLPDELMQYDAVVVDPPRAGAQAQAEILAGCVAPIVMVSCNPTTFARDARILCDGGYALQHVEIIDQFRWSPHVELAATLSKR